MKKTPKNPKKKGAEMVPVKNTPPVSPKVAAVKKILPHGKAAEAVPSKARFYIVGIGGSAGSLEAFEDFFRSMPADSGAAFVLVSHLDPTHKGVMPELIQRHTKMQVFEAEDGMKVRPDCVYVIPSNKDMGILHGTLQLLEPTATRGLRLPIDFFFKHLGQDQKEKAVGIIVSGMGTDGTAGLKTIKENSGMIMVQDPETSKFDSMPRSAIDTGLADYVAPADALPNKLMGYMKQTAKPITEPVIAEERVISDLQKIFIILRGQTGNDFSLYKKSTILRRIERRMNVHQIATTREYVEFLQANSHEVELLFKELLIGVTSFFRDPEAYSVLKEKVIPDILNAREKERTIRIWVPGCSTGEEAYSVAIVLSECMRKLKPNVEYKIQIFATDIDKEAIDKARQGCYPADIAAEISRDRLERFFVKEDNRYQINKGIREMVVFAPHNVIMDPPFTKLDLICCRNLLIYLTAELQKKLLAVFHYGLKLDGILFLGTSESIGRFTDFFSPVDTKWKIYQRRAALQAPVEAGDLAFFYRDIASSINLPKPQAAELVSIPDMANRMLLENFTPPAVFINEQGDLIYIHGRTGKYLEPPAGKANINIFAMAREGLRVELPSALREAKTQNKAVTLKDVRVKTNGDYQTINLTVKPLTQQGTSQLIYMVVFREMEMPPKEEPTAKGHGTSYPKLKTANIELEKELKRTRELLQSITEEMQLSQEELKSTNEELQSTNEELQSTNEELSSSKEEMQSLNEELMTVNAELQAKISELTQANDDMKNMLNRTEIATIFLDCELKIRRFTPEATKLFNLIPTDIDRPISHIVSNLKYDQMMDDVKKVLETLVFKETQVETKEGHWYLMRITPYRTHKDSIDGVVINFTDITALKKLESTLREKNDLSQRAVFAEGIIATIREPLVVLDADLKVVSASRSFYTVFGMTPEETENRHIYELDDKQWNIPALRKLLEDVLHKGVSFNDFVVEHNFPVIGRKKMLLNARKVTQGYHGEENILLAIEDLTGKH